MQEHVLQFLKSILDNPLGQCVPIVPEEGFRAAHFYGIVSLLNDGRGQAWSRHFKGQHAVGDGGVALYTTDVSGCF